MRSVWITRTGPPEVLEVRESPDPTPAAGEVLVRTRAAGINFADVMARLGLYPDAPKLPCVVGYEVAGTIERVGSGVTGVKSGDRVVALTRFGGYTEAIAVPEAQVFPMPAAMSFEEAAAVPVNYLTAVLMLRHFGNVRQGDRVLVHAAAGGVGMAAIQLCRIAGAEVIGTASASKHAALRDAGVAHAIDYRTQDFEQEVKRITGGRGVDIVLDATGAFGKSYRTLAPLGRLVCFGLSGAATGRVPSRLAARGRIGRLPGLQPNKLMNDNKAVIGVNLGHLWDRIELLRGEMLGLLADYDAGRIAPVVGKTFPLVQAAAAHRFIQERQNVGKVLLTAA
jgi:NADPH:quinone reductase-like Zn-dependent oxidoreductase